MSYQKKFNIFRLTFPELVYESHSYDVQPNGLHILFKFRLNESIVFQPCSFVPSRSFLSFVKDDILLDWIVFNIGMAELVSYWKAYCSPVVRVLPYRLDDSQIAFWRKLYYNGLGEFFYVNGIKAGFDDFMAIKADTGAIPPQVANGIVDVDNSSFLVPIGGGKDSVVTLDLLSDYCRQRSLNAPRPLIMNPRGATLQCCSVAGIERDDILEIQRTIDPLLVQHNAKGALNGHTPFSAVLAFYTLLASYLSGVLSVALSNENSANESTVVGSNVNHQYSKSMEFEDDFRAYVSRYMSPQFNYFSFLRPLSELQIASIFAQLEWYHDVFRSCNVGSKQDIWCGHCPKCLFAFIILSPFIAPQRLAAIFGRPLLDCEDMRPYFLQLVGMSETKPFECVGTISEVHEALALTLRRWYASGEPPLLLRGFQPSYNLSALANMSDRHNLSLSLFNHLSSYVLQGKRVARSAR